MHKPFDPAAPFADLESDFGAPAGPTSPEKAADEPLLDGDDAVTYENYGGTKSRVTIKRFACVRCNGSGRFISWAGRDCGPCHRCHGVGFTATDPNVLRARREKAANRKLEEAKRQSDNAKAFLAARPDIKAWLDRGADRGREFQMSLQDSLFRYGAWTPNQLAAVERSVAEDKRRDEERAAQAAVADSDPNALDLSKLPSGTYAVPGGDTRLKVRVSRPTKNSRWHGFIFVDDGAAYGSRQNYGRQAPGRKYVGKIVEQLRAILANPFAAAAAYGQLTGTCGVCGRPLEDEESVARGIGPICAGKF